MLPTTLRGSWAQVLRCFDNAGTATETPLTAAISMPLTAPCAYLCCTALYPNVPSRVFLIHTLLRFPPATLDGTVTPWNNMLFGCLDDVVQDTTVTVMILGTAFDLTVLGRVYMENILPEQLAPIQVQEMLLFLDNAVADTEHLRTRYLMYLPAHFAHLFLTNRGLTPKDTYLTFHQAVLHDSPLLITFGSRIMLHSSQSKRFLLQQETVPESSLHCSTFPVWQLIKYTMFLVSLYSTSNFSHSNMFLLANIQLPLG
jgi:hypothetical protein